MKKHSCVPIVYLLLILPVACSTVSHIDQSNSKNRSNDNVILEQEKSIFSNGTMESRLEKDWKQTRSSYIYSEIIDKTDLAYFVTYSKENIGEISSKIIDTLVLQKKYVYDKAIQRINIQCQRLDGNNISTTYKIIVAINFLHPANFFLSQNYIMADISGNVFKIEGKRDGKLDAASQHTIFISIMNQTNSPILEALRNNKEIRLYLYTNGGMLPVDIPLAMETAFNRYLIADQ